MSSPAASPFQDTSTECAICLCPLDGGGGGDERETVVQLTCGHRWHLACLREQLRHAQQQTSPRRRLLFSGCRCAKCGEFCDHPALGHLTGATSALRDRVRQLLLEQLRVERPECFERSADGGQRAAHEEEAWRTYAFYLCGSCREPYFGGTVGCADDVAAQDGAAGAGGPSPSPLLLCSACSEQTRTHCSHPERHRGYHAWKCRYCCRPANHVCYGAVHFCQSCHDRNSARVARQRRGGGGRPPPLEAIPCPGGDQCPYPKPPGRGAHSNGPSADCEQVYHCAWCLSNRRGEQAERAGSPNLIVNPSGQRGMQGWQRVMGRHGMPWQIERSEVPVNSTTATNFVSSFEWCVMAYRVPLYGYVRDPATVRIEASAKFMGRTDCPSVFQMEVAVLDHRRREVHRQRAGPFQAPADFWERTSITLEPVAGAREAVLIVCGKDSRFWRGNFGSKVAGCSVRVLCSSDEELDALLLPGARQTLERGEPPPAVDNDAAAALVLEPPLLNEAPVALDPPLLPRVGAMPRQRRWLPPPRGRANNDARAALERQLFPGAREALQRGGGGGGPAPPNENNRNNHNPHAAALEQQLFPGAREALRGGPAPPQARPALEGAELRRRLLYDLVLPVCLLVLAWLVTL